jgi:16S rRNA (uracil1498-N3)-methyltransferase
MVRLFVPKDDISKSQAVIAGQELQHLRRVLRLGPGDHVTLFDDAGVEHDAVIRSFGSDSATVEILRSYDAQRESSLDLTLAVGLTKGDKIDVVVEKATELGVQTIVPFVSAYTVPQLNERKIATRSQRWQKIALNAAKQCGRARIPEVLPLCEFHQLVSRPRPDTLKICFWEKEAQQSLGDLQNAQGNAKSLLIAVGPEGGFSAEEAALAAEHGFFLASLGRRILRAETAAITAVSLAQFLWGDLA